MDSAKKVKELEAVPVAGKYSALSYSQIMAELERVRRDNVVLEASVGIESALFTLFDGRNIPDALTDAYQLAFPNISADMPLHEKFTEMVDKGPESVEGFVSALKGKQFEVELPKILEEQFPDFEFEVAVNPTQPVWDLMGRSADGGEILVQAKMGGADYANEVAERMQESPDVLFAVSREIRDKIAAEHPELLNQIADVDVSNYDMTENTHHNLEILADNLGIDIPDQFLDILPYVSEIILGIRLIKDLIDVQRNFKQISAADKTKLSAVKTIVLLSRFGVSTVCTTVCSAAGAAGGSFFPGWGNIVGGIGGAVGGAFLASKLNKHLMPYCMEFALGISGLTSEDLFYFRNKQSIDRLGYSLLQQANQIG